MDKQQQQLFLSKSTRQRCNEWIFRDVPSDITIEVNGVTFALHKFPLVSRSRRIQRLVAEHRDSDMFRVELVNIPGGAESFELAAKFFYGINFEITSFNVAQLYCVSDYLEMTEEFSKDNLGSRAEEYLESVVCKNLEMCVEVLQQCESLLPLAHELKIVNRCIDAIASKACAEQIASSFSRLEYSSSGRLHMSRQAKCEGDWWIEDLSVIRIDLYERLITAMKCRGVRPESIGASLVNFAQKELTKKCSLWNPSGHTKADLVSTDHEQLVVETIVGLLPVEKLAVQISFLFGLLRSAVMLDCSIACRLDLERRIGSQLDIATLDDILIPSFRHAGDGTLFDVDTVQRLLVNFSQQDDSEEDMDDASVFESDSPRSPSQTALFKVAILVDNYLAEIAPDANLKLAKFMAVTETLPEHARTIHDGLYRAIDIYLKAHQGLSDEDKKKLCKLIDFQKLSQEAGAHAAQNERLPIQSIVQVLYFEQLRLRNALCCSFPEEDPKPVVHHHSWRINSGALSAAMSPRDNYASLRRENRELKLELTRMRMRLNDLEKDHVCMRDMVKSRPHKFMRSFSKKIGKLSLFGHSSSRGSSSPSRQSYRTDSKVIERTCASTD
ncbi:BTB/POZ domain-containing protein At5g48800-like [Hibiscus syriacus]|uniref:BTB/POZ domain-containing protein At5g48800-like n=1 Tax=Hibiscus syriacus TaxID=106335 RepID=UPI0019218CA3|nr:BTB/POZ domain-containing protein At5g48800-like [Hibiscus syriacus]